jgi:hypothetical protein
MRLRRIRRGRNITNMGEKRRANRFLVGEVSSLNHKDQNMHIYKYSAVFPGCVTWSLFVMK